MTLWLLDACDRTYGKEFTKKFKILLWIPIFNYIFVISNEAINFIKSYREDIKNL